MMQPRFSKIVAPGMMAIGPQQLRFVAALTVAVIGAFMLTLWVTQPRTPLAPAADVQSDEEKLASYRISNTIDLIEAAVATGFVRSRQMRANLDGITRINEREVTMGGWLADPGGDATPLPVLVFVGGKLAATVKTRGERPDVTRMYGLAFGAEKNVAFEARYVCRPGELPFVVGLGTDKTYFRILAPPCP